MREEHRRRLEAARDRAHALMDELGRQELGEPLQERGWSFAFDRARRRLGCCRANRKVVSLSAPLLARNGLEYRDENGLAVFEDVIRHEIAHAIDYELRGCSDHGARWQAVCRRVGADPSRLYEGDDMETVPGRYEARCPACGDTQEYHRRPRRVRACAACCRRHAGGRFDARFRLELVHRASGRIVPYMDEQRTPRGGAKRAPSSAEDGYKYTARCLSCGWTSGYRRRLKRERACPVCCRRHAGGRFDERFVLDIVQNY